MSEEKESLKDLLGVLDESAEDETLDLSEPAPEAALESEIEPETENEISKNPSSLPQCLSMTLQNVPKKHLPQDFICMHCPQAMWLLKGEDLICYCRAMQAPSYSTSDEDGIPVLICDGPFLQDGATL